MKLSLKVSREQFEKMPIYGQLRELDKRLTFGNYLTVLKEWWDKTERLLNEQEKEFREKLAQPLNVTIDGDMNPLPTDAYISVKEILGEEV